MTFNVAWLDQTDPVWLKALKYLLANFSVVCAYPYGCTVGSVLFTVTVLPVVSWSCRATNFSQEPLLWAEMHAISEALQSDFRDESSTYLRGYISNDMHLLCE